MSGGERGIRGRVSVRVRLLAIVAISSVTLLVLGVTAAGYLVRSGSAAKDWAELAGSTTTPAVLMVKSFEEERRLSLLQLGGSPDAAAGLAVARQHSDEALAAIIAKGDAARKLNPDGSQDEIAGYQQLFTMVPQIRTGVDTRLVPPDQVFQFFTGVIETIASASVLAARVAPGAGVAMALNFGVHPLRAAEAMSKADTLGTVALVRGELTPAQLIEFDGYVGEFRSAAAYAATVLKGSRLAQLTAITGGAAWQQVIAMQDAIAVRGPVTPDGDDSRSAAGRSGRPALPLSTTAWQNASAQVGAGLLTLWEDQSHDAQAIARADSSRQANNSLAGGAAVLVLALLALLAALLLANGFVARMHRLRSHTLELAGERLPALMERLRRGEHVDPDAEVSRLDFGTDELGEVADAFNRAHVAAVAAAVAEARTRAGFNAVFLNIAHRSQVVVHRQLALLDRAERTEEDADQLEMLFELDHLATRARRNAENLIILGGGQPGRRWRKPVPLHDVIRAAVAEGLDYARCRIGRVPDVRIAGDAVADLIHLMAELTDNATAFSPPPARVDISAAVVGRGLAVEISDQGLGMPAADLAARNELLSHPPEFSMATVSGDTRLGLFVVAKLAARHAISVHLGDSDYGGVRVIVLIPRNLIDANSAGLQPMSLEENGRPPRPRLLEAQAEAMEFQDRGR
ncbi:nitrate- and nitrite sensing domain-containing protein [Nocardia sp. BMG111209]|uniref:sensor histidine kinase n=1 Tax=Nocardia sp. BMG111209 TaxID=1160137 RepID=UPI001E2CA19E|nr:nitrate- and nitrite sensing domain-containing protein [Nocardia sp. BMG111209]